MVSPVHVVFSSIGISRTSQKAGRVLVSQFLVADTESGAGIHRSLGGGKLERLWVHVHIGGFGCNLSGIVGLFGARQVQNVVIVGLDSAEKGCFVGIKHKVLTVPFQQVVLENGTFVMSNNRENWRRWFVKTLVDGKSRHRRKQNKQVCKEKLHFFKSVKIR